MGEPVRLVAEIDNRAGANKVRGFESARALHEHHIDFITREGQRFEAEFLATFGCEQPCWAAIEHGGFIGETTWSGRKIDQLHVVQREAHRAEQRHKAAQCGRAMKVDHLRAGIARQAEASSAGRPDLQYRLTGARPALETHRPTRARSRACQHLAPAPTARGYCRPGETNELASA